MVGKCLCIALFAILQISSVLCRSTGTPNVKDDEFLPTSQSIVDGKERLKVFAPESIPKGTEIPENMLYDNYREIHDDFVTTYNNVLTAYAIVGIVIGVFAILSLILGVIMMIMCKKPPRQGHVVGSSTGGMQQPGVTGNAVPMQLYPSPYGQKQ